MFVVTQYNSASLNRHVSRAYRFDRFGHGFVTILAAEQTPDSEQWYQGTADAVRQCLQHINAYPHRRVLILSGDQLYRMDFNTFSDHHRSTWADLTVATVPVTADEAPAFGILKTDADGIITEFHEKPARDELDGLDSPVSERMREAGADLPRVDGDLHVRARRAPRGAPRERRRDRLRQGDHPGRHPLAPRRELPPRRVLVRHRDRPVVLRREPRPRLARARVRPLRRGRPNLHELADAPAGQDRGLPRRRLDDRRGVGRLAGRPSTTRSSASGRSWARAPCSAGSSCSGPTTSRGATPPGGPASTRRRARGSAAGASSRTRSSTRTSRSAPTAGSRTRAATTDADGDGWYIRDGIVVLPKNAIVPDGTVI